MGSFFYINVPIREFEASLRQKAQNITIKKEVDNVAKELVSGTGQITTFEDMPAPSMRSETRNSITRVHPEHDAEDDGLPKSESGSMSSSRRLTIAEHFAVKETLGQKVDLYEAEVDGKRANIVVSKDSMAVYNLEDDLGQNKLKWKKENPEAEEEAALQAIINNTFLEKHLEDSLKKFNIINAKWSYSIDGNFAEVSFTVEAEKSEEIIQYMVTLGIGVKYQSTLSVCAAIVFYNEHTESKKKNVEEMKLKEEIGRPDHPDSPDLTPSKQTFGTKFKASIKSRLTVAQVIQTVEGNAVMTFDFIILIIVAGLIAGFGLLENSSVSLVASMLISPLMGPIMAGCFGSVIRDFKLVTTGVVSELVGLGICLIVGFFCGVFVTWEPFPGPWTDIERWPTDEMVSRALLRGMVVGVFIAIPSGAGVALSILAGNAGSLVGVAISASLLPPAVNCGLFWGMAATIAINEMVNNRTIPLECESHVGPPNTTEFYARNHTHVYCANVLEEFAFMGIVSFGLTVINILIILIVGAVVLKIKEVAPHTTRATMKRFWKEDLKVMRAYNRIHGSFDKQALLSELIASDNAAEIQEDVANDHTFNQVNRRNLFGPQAVILEPDLQSHITIEEVVGPLDVETGSGGGGDQKKVLQSTGSKRGSSAGTTFWNGLARMFSRKPSPRLSGAAQQPAPLPVEFPPPSPTARVQSADYIQSDIITSDGGALRGRPRPKLKK